MRERETFLGIVRGTHARDVRIVRGTHECSVYLQRRLDAFVDQIDQLGNTPDGATGEDETAAVLLRSSFDALIDAMDVILPPDPMASMALLD